MEERERKGKSGNISPPMDLTARLDCCNLVSLGQRDDHSLDLFGVGEKARKPQSPMASNTLRLGGNAQVPPLVESFQFSGGRPQKRV